MLYMNILQVNKFFYIRGGSAIYMFELSELLKFHDHNISFFSMQDVKNRKSTWNKYFVSNATIDKFSIKKIFKVFERMMYSSEVINKISELLNKYQIDIAYHQPDIWLLPAVRALPNLPPYLQDSPS